MNPAQSETSSSEGIVRQQSAVTPEATSSITSSRSLIQMSGRLILLIVLVLFGGIMCLGVGVALLEAISSYYDKDDRLGEFLFTALFEGFLGWGSLWLALRVSPWAQPGRKSWRWVRIVLATTGVILTVAALIVVVGALAWFWLPLRHHNAEVPSAMDLTGTWNLVLKESSPDFGPAEIESGTLEFFAGGRATRTLRLKQFGKVTEYVSYMDDWKLVGSDKLRFKLREGRDRLELSISLSEDQLSFTDWETYGVETWHRVLTKPTE